MIERGFTLILLVCIIAPAFAFSPPPKRVDATQVTGSQSPTTRPDTSLDASIKQRLTFNSPPPLRNGKEPPKLILISGCPGKIFVFAFL